MLQSMGSQRVRHDWVTELNWKLHYRREFTICYKWLLNTLCKWILLGKLREEAEWQMTSGLYKKHLRKKTGRIPPNCPWWLFLDGRTPGGFSSCSYVFIYVFSKLSTNSMGGVIFQWLFWSTVKKKKKQGRSDEHERKVKQETCCVKDKPTGLGLGPLRNFLFFAVHSFSDSLFSYIFIKIQRTPKWRRFSSCPQAASSYSQFLLTVSSP